MKELEEAIDILLLELRLNKLSRKKLRRLKNRTKLEEELLNRSVRTIISIKKALKILREVSNE